MREKVANKLFTCFAEVYNPSIKDIEISRDKSVKASLTINIRDPQTDYYVDNKHQVKVFDNRTRTGCGILPILDLILNIRTLSSLF